MLEADLNLYKFDWDMTWAGFFMNAQGFIYARYGVRKERNGEKSVSLAGLRETMKGVLKLHKKEAARAAPPWKPATMRDLPSYRKDPQSPQGCAHCHHAWTYTRKNEMDQGQWKREKLWVFPLAENLGITLDLDANTLVKEAAGPAASAGIQPGDRVTALQGQRVLTPADMSWVLHNFQGGTLKVDLERDGAPAAASLALPGMEWRKRDLSWRESVNVLSPQTGFWARECNPEDRKKLGLPPDAIAIRVKMVTPAGAGKAAGIRVDDVIVGVDGKTKAMSEAEFTQHVWMDCNPGTVLKLTVLRANQQMPIGVMLK